MNKEKKYKLLREVLNATTSHIIPVGEIFKQYKDTRKYYSSNGWQMSEDSCLKKDWFEEFVEELAVEMPNGAMQFLKAAGNYWQDGENEYYNLPFWYKFIKNNVAIPYTQEEFDNLPSRKEWALKKIFEVKSDSTQGILTPQNWKQEEEVPLLQKGYKILSTRYNNKQSCEEGIQSVRRLFDNTIWTVGDIVNVAGHKELEIVALNESLGVVYANLKWNYNGSISGTQTVLQNLQKI